LASISGSSASVSLFDDAPYPFSWLAPDDRVVNTILGPLLNTNPDEREMLLTTLVAFFAFQGSAIGQESTCIVTPTVRHRLRCSECQTGGSLQDPDRQRNYSSLWRRCAGCPSRPVATPEADRIRRRRSAR
jgi:hypothetical protein